MYYNQNTLPSQTNNSHNPLIYEKEKLVGFSNLPAVRSFYVPNLLLKRENKEVKINWTELSSMLNTKNQLQIVLRGMTGTGKTTLAAQLAREYVKSNKNFAFFLSTNSEQQLDVDYQDLACNLATEASEKEELARYETMQDIKSRRKKILLFVKNILTKKFSNGFLLVFENANNNEMYSNYHQSLPLNNWGNINIIVTTQNKNDIFFAASDILDINMNQGLEKTDSVQLLKDLTGLTKGAEELAQTVDYLPLSLVITGYVIKRRLEHEDDSDMLIKYLQEKNNSGHGTNSPSIVQKQQAISHKILEESVKELLSSYKENNNKSIPIIKLLSLIDPIGLPLSLLALYIEKNKYSATVKECLDDDTCFFINKKDTEFFPNQKKTIYTLHAAVQPLIRKYLLIDTSTNHEFYKIVFSVLLDSFSDEKVKNEDVNTRRFMCKNIEIFLNYLEKINTNEYFDLFGLSYYWLGYTYGIEQVDPLKSLIFFDKAIEYHKKSHNYLALVKDFAAGKGRVLCRIQSNPEDALKKYEIALNILEEHKNNIEEILYNKTLARVFSYKAEACTMCGDYNQAIVAIEQAIQLDKINYPPHDPQLYVAADRLYYAEALIVKKDKESLDNAIDTLHQVFNQYSNNENYNSYANLAKINASLGKAYYVRAEIVDEIIQQQSDINNAEHYFFQAMETYKKIFHEGHSLVKKITVYQEEIEQIKKKFNSVATISR